MNVADAAKKPGGPLVAAARRDIRKRFTSDLLSDVPGNRRPYGSASLDWEPAVDSLWESGLETRSACLILGGNLWLTFQK
jgi:hypothetical protein